MTTGDWSYGVDINVPSAARMTDYYLGGNHNFAADREAAEQILGAIPDMRRIAVANRAFLGEAVRFMLQQGVQQFLDIGAGIPTIGSVHEIAASHSGTRVVYVDTDPVAVEHAIATLRGHPHATALRADLRFPEAIFGHYNVRSTLDLNLPVGLLLLSVLPFIEDSAAYPAVTQLVGALAPGSYLALSHVLDQALTPERVDTVADVYRRSTSPLYARRDRDQILSFLHGLDLVGPGLVEVTQWRPGLAGSGCAAADRGRDVVILAAVASKPGRN